MQTTDCGEQSKGSSSSEQAIKVRSIRCKLFLVYCLLLTCVFIYVPYRATVHVDGRSLARPVQYSFFWELPAVPNEPFWIAHIEVPAIVMEVLALTAFLGAGIAAIEIWYLSSARSDSSPTFPMN